ncbi:MAG TPA: hypothetical protein VK783_04300 [Bacteroidia bacterium]|jgi:hypothetical protein|nr:hypothetical protein [Bacteroidia bacterium]
MKSVATILLFVFSLLTIQPILSIAEPIQKMESCTKSCCMHHEQKKAPKPMKGMCGDMSCNPFGQYACCTGFIVSDNNQFAFASNKLQEYSAFYNSSYAFHYTCQCWQPPENTACLIG